MLCWVLVVYSCIASCAAASGARNALELQQVLLEPSTSSILLQQPILLPVAGATKLYSTMSGGRLTRKLEPSVSAYLRKLRATGSSSDSSSSGGLYSSNKIQLSWSSRPVAEPASSVQTPAAIAAIVLGSVLGLVLLLLAAALIAFCMYRHRQQHQVQQIQTMYGLAGNGSTSSWLACCLWSRKQQPQQQQQLLHPGFGWAGSSNWHLSGDTESSLMPHQAGLQCSAAQAQSGQENLLHAFSSTVGAHSDVPANVSRGPSGARAGAWGQQSPGFVTPNPSIRGLPAIPAQAAAADASLYDLVQQHHHKQQQPLLEAEHAGPSSRRTSGREAQGQLHGRAVDGLSGQLGLLHAEQQQLLQEAYTTGDGTACASGDPATGTGDMALKPGGGQHKRQVFEAARKQLGTKAGDLARSDALVLESVLGEGTFGKVFKGYWKGTRVAVKTMMFPAAMSGKEKREKMAIMETAISASLSHPNIVQMYTYYLRPVLVGHEATMTREAAAEAQRLDSSSVGDSTMNAAFLSEGLSDSVHSWEVQLVLEFCDQGSLRVLLNKHGPFSLPDGRRDMVTLLDTALDVARAMVHLHSENIIHSDLKARNILLKSSGGADGRPFVAKVADFGLSMRIDPDATHVSNVYQGTMTHMAPEVMLRGKLSRGSDVYAFGVLLWELYSGGHAFKGIPRALLGHEVAHQQRRPPFPDDCPFDFQLLACRCWESDASIRPSFSEIVSELMRMRERMAAAAAAEKLAAAAAAAKLALTAAAPRTPGGSVAAPGIAAAAGNCGSRPQSDPLHPAAKADAPQADAISDPVKGVHAKASSGTAVACAGLSSDPGKASPTLGAAAAAAAATAAEQAGAAGSFGTTRPAAAAALQQPHPTAAVTATAAGRPGSSGQVGTQSVPLLLPMLEQQPRQPLQLLPSLPPEQHTQSPLNTGAEARQQGICLELAPSPLLLQHSPQQLQQHIGVHPAGAAAGADVVLGSPGRHLHHQPWSKQDLCQQRRSSLPPEACLGDLLLQMSITGSSVEMAHLPNGQWVPARLPSAEQMAPELAAAMAATAGAAVAGATSAGGIAPVAHTSNDRWPHAPAGTAAAVQAREATDAGMRASDAGIGAGAAACPAAASGQHDSRSQYLAVSSSFSACGPGVMVYGATRHRHGPGGAWLEEASIAPGTMTSSGSPAESATAALAATEPAARAQGAQGAAASEAVAGNSSAGRAEQQQLQKQQQVQEQEQEHTSTAALTQQAGGKGLSLRLEQMSLTAGHKLLPASGSQAASSGLAALPEGQEPSEAGVAEVHPATVGTAAAAAAAAAAALQEPAAVGSKAASFRDILPLHVTSPAAAACSSASNAEAARAIPKGPVRFEQPQQQREEEEQQPLPAGWQSTAGTPKRQQMASMDPRSAEVVTPDSTKSRTLTDDTSSFYVRRSSCESSDSGSMDGSQAEHHDESAAAIAAIMSLKAVLAKQAFAGVASPQQRSATTGGRYSVDAGTAAVAAAAAGSAAPAAAGAASGIRPFPHGGIASQAGMAPSARRWSVDLRSPSAVALTAVNRAVATPHTRGGAVSVPLPEVDFQFTPTFHDLLGPAVHRARSQPLPFSAAVALQSPPSSVPPLFGSRGAANVPGAAAAASAMAAAAALSNNADVLRHGPLQQPPVLSPLFQQQQQLMTPVVLASGQQQRPSSPVKPAPDTASNDAAPAATGAGAVNRVGRCSSFGGIARPATAANSRRLSAEAALSLQPARLGPFARLSQDIRDGLAAAAGSRKHSGNKSHTSLANQSQNPASSSSSPVAAEAAAAAAQVPGMEQQHHRQQQQQQRLLSKWSQRAPWRSPVRKVVSASQLEPKAATGNRVAWAASPVDTTPSQPLPPQPMSLDSATTAAVSRSGPQAAASLDQQQQRPAHERLSLQLPLLRNYSQQQFCSQNEQQQPSAWPGLDSAQLELLAHIADAAKAQVDPLEAGARP